MKRVTVDQVMSWQPCPEYTRERVEKLFAGRKTVTVRDILDMDIPPADKLWAVLHPELIPETDLHELACRFAESALLREREAGREPDPRSWAAIKAKRAWLRGEITDEQLVAAWKAAWAVWAEAPRASEAAWWAAEAAYAAAEAAEAAYAAAAAAQRATQEEVETAFEDMIEVA